MEIDGSKETLGNNRLHGVLVYHDESLQKPNAARVAVRTVRRLRVVHNPPVTSMVRPVTKSACDDARKQITFA